MGTVDFVVCTRDRPKNDKFLAALRPYKSSCDMSMDQEEAVQKKLVINSQTFCLTWIVARCLHNNSKTNSQGIFSLVDYF